MNIEVFSRKRSELGESCCWHRGRGSLFWVDILSKKIYEKFHNSKENIWGLECIPSVVFEVENCQDRLWVLTNIGLLLLNLNDGSYIVSHQLVELNEGMRTNDAGVDPDGNLVYGTMYVDPKKGFGSIYRLNKDSSVNLLREYISIPNTFVWGGSENDLYSADSFVKKMYKYNYKSDLDRECFFSEKNGEPDGSVMDEEENIWTAFWGAGCVIKYNLMGEVLEKINLPVRNPTSCDMDHEGNMYVTTASIGSREKELDGCVLKFKTNANPKGKNFLKFPMN